MQTPKHHIDKAILVGLDAACFSAEQTATESSLDELEALLLTAGGVCAGRVLQNRQTPDPHSFIGQGKAEEIRDLIAQTGADLLVFDNALSLSQVRALEQITGAVVLDRSALILDIFAQRAKTAEGRLQVELAQYRYLLPRLSGAGTALSRLGGGIGTRGPGETKLEMDRRYIRDHITRLERELQTVRKNRAVQRRLREKNAIPVVALVGYTNAGKSTILNRLTGAQIPANDRLFDTLDTTTRKLKLSQTLEILLTDTVGFIAKLPHQLIKAFEATLEELRYADLLIHVIDASDENRQAHIEVVEKLIASLAGQDIPVIQCYNKTDLTDDILPHGEKIVSICAKDGAGFDGLLRCIERTLNRGVRRTVFLFPYTQAAQVDALHRLAQVLRCEYRPEGVVVEALCDAALCARLQEYEKER